MPFIPHTEAEAKQMLEAIGVADIDALFDEIPKALRLTDYQENPGLSELEMLQQMGARAAADGTPVCFAGAGAYYHHIPAAVWEITTRGEFYSAYTPYQAEASQGTLQLLYEYQTMMSNLMAMDVSNTSLYDGASGLGEAVLMAVRGNRKSKSKKILVPATTPPGYRKVAHTIVKNQNIELVELGYDADTGTTLLSELEAHAGEDYAAMVIPFPNCFGKLEEVDVLTDWAHDNGMLVIAQVNPIAVSWLTPPGDWGTQGADIACGEGQPLGVPMSSGGPYFGFLCCTDKLVRQMPGRLIGKTVDVDGKEGFALTLQAREQHIRRSKATSNICTNQGLLVTAATIHMSIMGEPGLCNTAIKSHENTALLTEKLTAIDGVEQVFAGPNFHEVALKIAGDVDEVIHKLALENIVAGVHLGKQYPELENVLLTCATEKRTEAEINDFAAKLAAVLGGK